MQISQLWYHAQGYNLGNTGMHQAVNPKHDQLQDPEELLAFRYQAEPAQFKNNLLNYCGHSRSNTINYLQLLQIYHETTMELLQSLFFKEILSWLGLL